MDSRLTLPKERKKYRDTTESYEPVCQQADPRHREQHTETNPPSQKIFHDSARTFSAAASATLA